MDNKVFAAVRYADADAALQWFKQALGAQEQAVHRDENGVIHHSELLIEGGLVMLAAHRPEGRAGGEPPRPLASPLSLYTVVADPDAHHARALAAGARIVRELQDTPYGSREYSLRDLEGNLWSFGTYDPAAGV